jgi:hypothetical protein
MKQRDEYKRYQVNAGTYFNRRVLSRICLTKALSTVMMVGPGCKIRTL